jgi:AcrR family transcriptional regulator
MFLDYPRGNVMSKQKSNTTQDEEAGKTSENRKKILATSLRLFTAQGVDATPTAQISKEAGLSTGTLFHYFPDKNNLVEQLYLSIKKEMAGVFRANDDETLPTKQRLEQSLRGYILWGMANPEKVRFLEQFYNSPSICDEGKCQACDDFAWLMKLGKTAIHEGLLRDLPCEFYMVMISRILDGILFLSESRSSGMSQEEIIENGIAMLWNRDTGSQS